MKNSDLILATAHLYVQRRGYRLEGQLGCGDQGYVFQSSRMTAVKVLNHHADYQRERDVYLRLRQHGVNSIARCSVPELVDCDDEHLVIEMTIVSPPRVLDFASAILDVAPQYRETVTQRRAMQRSKFGAAWPDICAIIKEFEALGIFLLDVSPENVRLS